MAFWIRKNANEKSDPAREQDSIFSKQKKKDEKKGPAVKRVDNLRIATQLKVVLKSLGTRNEFKFFTKDLSATGAFVVCPDIWAYPFQQQSTILDCIVDLIGQNQGEGVKIRFLAKIARVVEASPTNPSQVAGFGVRIVQMSHDHRHILENYIARHGTPEFLGSTPEQKVEPTESEQNEASKSGENLAHAS